MADKQAISGPFYHGTKADLKPGDLISPGHRSNYGHSKRRSVWVYMSAILSPWGAELALGDGPGRIYVVEPTGPFVDDPDLTDMKFPGNPTKSYRSRDPLRVVGEVTDWQPHSPEQIQAMKEGRDRRLEVQAAQIACIPSEADFHHTEMRALELARQQTPNPERLGCLLLMRIRGAHAEVSSTLHYSSQVPAQTQAITLPRPVDATPTWPDGEVSLSGRITDITAWRDAWEAVLESCITEIGLSLDARVWIAVDANNDRLTFRVDADGPQRSWQRNLSLLRGVLTDAVHGRIWDFKADGP